MVPLSPQMVAPLGGGLASELTSRRRIDDRRDAPPGTGRRVGWWRTTLGLGDRRTRRLWRGTSDRSKDSDRYKVANCTQAQPVFCGMARSARGKVILVSVLSVGFRPLPQTTRNRIHLNQGWKRHPKTYRRNVSGGHSPRHSDGGPPVTVTGHYLKRSRIMKWRDLRSGRRLLTRPARERPPRPPAAAPPAPDRSP